MCRLKKSYDKVCREKVWRALGGLIMVCSESGMCMSWWKAVRSLLHQPGSETRLRAVTIVFMDRIMREVKEKGDVQLIAILV